MNDRSPAPGRSIFPRFWVAILFSALVAGCVDTATPAPEAASAEVHPSNMARRPGISPSGATIAVGEFDGVPQSLAEPFKASFSQEARAHDITLADGKKANYTIRGYLNASREASGTKIAFVLDVFDARRQRAQRIEDQISMSATAPDPWSVVDQSVLTAVAAKSTADLADFLTNTPEAIANNEVAQPHSVQAAADEGQTTVAASAPAPAPQAPSQASRGTGLASLH
jgi:hypothetical protein